jgi:hemoglobin/transferrin/lactoferrin receptor protein
MYLLPLLAALAPAAPAGIVHAQERIVVTAVASRRAETLDATPATVSVIERADLERTLARDVRDALRYEPGVSVENGATRFGLGNIAIRGLDGNRVVMLQDGVRMPDNYRVGSFSNANRNPFELGLLSRIEILRGPGSALYGSDALAGVVSLTTIDPRDVLGRDARAAGWLAGGYAQADRSTSRTGAAALRSGGVEALAAASRTDGRERENRGEVGGAGAARTEPNPQDGRSEAALAKLVVPTKDGGRWRVTYDGFERRVATDVASLNPQSTKTVSLLADDRAKRDRFGVDGEALGLGRVDQISWLVYRQRSRTEQDTTEERANTTAQCLSANGTVRCRREARFRFEQEETGFTLIGQSAAGRHKAVYGVEGARIETVEQRDGLQTNLDTGAVTSIVGTDIFPTRDFPNSRVDRLGAFAQDEVAFDRFTLIPALRFDRFEMRPEPDDLYTASNPGRSVVALTDSAWSPKLGALVPLGRQATLTVQLAAGFRAPPYADANVGLSNLPLGYAVIANPDLEPEKSRGLELGVRGRHAAFDYALTAYRTDYSDLIVSRAPLPCPGDPRCVPGAPITFQSQNITKARIEGVEARGEARIAAGWTAKAGAAWSRGDDRSKGVPLNSVDPAKIVAGVAWSPAPRAWGGELIVTHAARKTRIDASAGVLAPTPSYTVADFTAFARIGPHVEVHAGVFNLFDRKYWLWSDVKGVPNAGASFERYTQPGRNASASVKVRF